MKIDRLNLIRQIVESQVIRTQEELADALKARGIRVTQATISRDIKELHLIKAMDNDGSSRYVISERSEHDVSERMIRLLSDSVISVDSAGNLIVVQTLSASAHVAAEAIDSLHWATIVGTIAGDNTVLIVARSDEGAHQVREGLCKLMNMKN